MNIHQITAHILIVCCLVHVSLYAVSTQDIDQTIKKINSESELISGSDIDTIVQYIWPRYYLTPRDAATQQIDIILQDPRIVKKIAQSDTCWIEQLETSSLHFLAKQYPGIITALLPTVIKHMNNIEPLVIQIFIIYNQDMLNVFAKAAIQIINTVDVRILWTITSYDRKYLIEFIRAAFEKKAPIMLINTLLQYAKEYNITVPAKYNIDILKKRVQSFFAQRPVKISSIVLTMIVIYKHMFGSLPYALPALTHTQQHAVTNADILATSMTFTTYGAQQQYTDMIDQIMTKEQELDKLGYYSFVHGQRWQFRLIEQWYTKLWELRYHRSVGDYIFIHCKKPNYDKAHLAQELDLRKQILSKGGYRWQEDKLLFVNYGFFCNDGYQGSSTAHYILENYSMGNFTITLKDVFYLLGYETIYNSYAQEVEALEEEHKTISSKGHLLLIGVPKPLLSNYVYLSGAFGVISTATINGQATSDMKTIIDTIRKNPDAMANSNIIQFCLVLTDDLLTPDSGLKVYSYQLADPAKFTQFEQKSAELFARIKSTIEQQQNR